MIYIGVDPGLEGCCAFLASFGDGVTFADLPTVSIGTRRDYDISAIVDIFRQHAGATSIAAIELIQPNPKFGNVTNASLGRCRGLLEGILATLAIPYELVRPQTWKASLMAGLPKEKSASILAAKRLFPQVADRMTLARHHNRADALLIAAWLQRSRSGV